MQIKYRIPASEIIRLSLSPYFDDIAVFHVKAVSYVSTSYVIMDILYINDFVGIISNFIIICTILDLGEPVT